MNMPRARDYNRRPRSLQRELAFAFAGWIGIAAIWYIAKVGISGDVQAAVEAAVSSLALTVVWMTLRLATSTRIEEIAGYVFDRLPTTRVVIEEQAVVNTIKPARPLWQHYTNLLSTLTQRINTLAAGRPVEVDPYIIYDHILSCATVCTSSVISVDCDLGAWYYLCEPADFDATYSGDQDQLEREKLEFVQERIQRRRVDFTYKLTQILLGRLGGDLPPTLQGMTPIRRVFVVFKDPSQLDLKDRVILTRVRKMQASVRRHMQNRVVFVPSLETAQPELATLLRGLQDTIVFDGVVCFKEYLLEPRDRRGSQIIVDTAVVERVIDQFERLFGEYAVDVKNVEV